MELFLVFLIVRLCASEKLYLKYLPPSGAKLAGGSSEHLQTPLENPEEALNFEPETNNSFYEDAGTQSSEEANGISKNNNVASNNASEVNLSIENNDYIPAMNLNKYPEMEYKNTEAPKPSPSFQYPDRGPLGEDATTDFSTDGYHYEKHHNIPIISVTESIIQNYQPNAFGMYGGNPMFVKSYPELQHINLNPFVDHNNSANVVYSSGESYSPESQKVDFTGTTGPDEVNSKSEMYPTTVNSVKVNSRNSIQRNMTRKLIHKRLERPQTKSDQNAVTLNEINVITSDRYLYNFNTSNGIHKNESAITTDGVRTSGSYSYTGDDGKVYSVIYSADENGFQPKGDHLPTPPPIPKAIQKVIEQAKKDKEAGIFHDGSYDEEKYGHMKYQGPISRYLQKMQEKLRFKNRHRTFKENRKSESAASSNAIAAPVTTLNPYKNTMSSFEDLNSIRDTDDKDEAVLNNDSDHFEKK